MIKAVATEENIQALADNSPKHKLHPEWQGKWSVAGPIKTEYYPYFNINNKPIAYEASCSFTFIGIDTSKTPPVQINDTETITLKAKETIIQKFVLCDGDEEVGNKNNRLRIQSTNHLSTD